MDNAVKSLMQVTENPACSLMFIHGFQNISYKKIASLVERCFLTPNWSQNMLLWFRGSNEVTQHVVVVQRLKLVHTTY